MNATEYFMQWSVLIFGMWLAAYGILYAVSPTWAGRFRGWTVRQLAAFLRWMGRTLGNFIQQNPIPFGIGLLIIIILVLSAIRVH